MTDTEKKKKAAMIAVAYYLSKQNVALNDFVVRNIWSGMGKQSIMDNRMRVQRRGRGLSIR